MHTLQTTLNRMTSPVRSFAAGTWLGLFAVLTLCLGTAPVRAGSTPTPPIVVSGATTVLGGGLQYNGAGGGWFSGQAPLGGTFVVALNGDVIVGDGYGGSVHSGVFQITPAGVQTIIANFTNSNAAGMDQYGNVYIARDYGAAIIKLPFVSGQLVGFPPGATDTADDNIPTTNCLGGNQDTAPCVFVSGTQSLFASGSGFTSLLFDGQGDFFFATDTNAGTPNTIYECLASGLPACSSPKLIYTDPNAALGSVAVDPWGNLFFSDGAGNSNGNKTYVEELPFSGGKYASTPTTLETYTTAANYNGIGGVVANSNAIYFSIPNDGTYAIPNSSSGPVAAGLYKVANQGGKGLAMDGAGNIYTLNYSGSLSADAVEFTPMGNMGFGASPVGTAAAGVPVTIIDMAGNCTSAPTLAFTSTAEYAATVPATSSCGTALNSGSGAFSLTPLSGGAVYSSTITFTPAKAGRRDSDLIITDSANSASGITALRGVGQGAAANVDPGVATTYGTTLTKPASIVGDSAGDVFIADAGTGKVYEIANGTSTLTQLGSGFTAPDALTLDPNGDLLIADNGTLTVTEIPNTGAPGTFTAGTQWTVISTADVFGSAALGSATGLAIGTKGTLYASDPVNHRVVYYNLITGQSGVTLANASSGLQTPMGLATDSNSTLYIADAGANDIVELSSGALSTIPAPNSITQAVGVAVDASGSILIADGASGNIVRIPDVSGTLGTAVTVETLPSAASSLWANSSGNLFVGSQTGPAAYAIQRSAASINLGTVADGAFNTGNIYLMNAGNEAATLGSPADVTEPTNTIFSLTPASTNGCSPGGTGPAGDMCIITAEFAPQSGQTGPLSDSTGAILVATPSLTIPVTISGTASISSLQSQTITYSPAPPASGFVGQQVTLSATSTSGLAVVITSATPTLCTVTGTTATFIAAGTCTIDANQSGGSNGGQNWGAAPQVVTHIAVTSATQAGAPGMVMNQLTWLNPTGSFTDGQTPSGGSFAVGPNGQIFVGATYNNKVYVVNAQTGATITTVSVNGPGGLTTDSTGNLYVAHLYNNIIYKVPYVSATKSYAAWTDNPTPAPPACTGSDTAECTFVSYPSGAPNSGGIKAIAFDPSGNFYMVSEPDGSNTLTGTSNIYMCNSACQPAGTGVLLYTDANGVSQIAFDPWGNLFFTDANYDEAGTNNESNSGASASGLYEIPAAALATQPITVTPTPLQTFTNTGTPGGYDDMLASVAVNPVSGTIYYGVLYDGTFAIPNTQAGGPVVGSQFAVSNQGAKALEADSKGNVYLMANTGGSDTLGFMTIGNMIAANAQYLGTPSTTAANVVDNAIGYCPSTGPTLVFASSNPAEFAATAGTTCSGIGLGDGTILNPLNGTFGSASSYPATITFTPENPNTQTGTFAISDTLNGGVGSANVTAVALTTPQTIAFTEPTATTFTYTPTLTIPIAATTTGPSNSTTNMMTFTLDATSTGKGTISAPVLSSGTWSATLTVTQAGTFVIDAAQGGGLVNSVYYSAATQQSATLTVNKAMEYISFTPPASPLIYSPTLTATLTASTGGSTSPITFAIDPTSTGQGSVSTSTGSNGTYTATLTVTQAGTFVLDASQATDPNYNAAQVSSNLVVNQASQTITVTPVTTPFYYIASCSPISLCASVQVTATGGATNNPIAFSPDPSSTVQFAVLSSATTNGTTTAIVALLPNQSPTFPAKLVIDANQQGNANYSAATQVPFTISVLKPLPTQAITWANPGTQVAGSPLTMSATASSGFAVVYTSSTPTVCTVSGATVTFIGAGTCTVTATQPGDNATYAPAPPVTETFTVNAKGQNPGIGLTLSLNAVVLEPGTVGTSSITVTSQNNFTGSVVFSCSGLPTGYSCSFNPVGSTTSPLIVQEGQSSTTTLSIISPASASLERGSRPFAPLATLAAALVLIGFRKRNRIFLVLLITLSVVGLSLFTGCGGSSTTASTSSTSSVTVTATATGMAGASGSVSQTATVSVTTQSE